MGTTCRSSYRCLSQKKHAAIKAASHFPTSSRKRLFRRTFFHTPCVALLADRDCVGSLVHQSFSWAAHSPAFSVHSRGQTVLIESAEVTNPTKSFLFWPAFVTANTVEPPGKETWGSEKTKMEVLPLILTSRSLIITSAHVFLTSLTDEMEYGMVLFFKNGI